MHQKNRFNLTDSGRVVFAKCQAIFESVDTLRVETKVAKKDFAGTISFATSHSIALTVLPHFLSALKKKYPLVTPKFRLGKTPLVKRWLEDREIDFAITVDNGALKSFEKIIIHSGQFIAIHTKKPDFDVKLAGFIITESRPETEILKKAFSKHYGKVLPLAMEVDSWEIIKRLVHQGLGIGYIPQFVLGVEGFNNLSLYKNSHIPKIKYDLCVIQNPGRPSSRLSSLFISELQKYLLAN